MEKLLTKSQYFTLCAIHAMDEETARVFASMTDDDKRELGDENAVVNVRIGELSRIPPIPFYYETAALVAARNGWLEAFHKYLSKVEQDETERVTARCVLKAIVHQNYHIANATPVENFGDEFYSEFPDGRVSPKFFASLFMPGLLRREIGRKIARDLYVTDGHNLHLYNSVANLPLLNSGLNNLECANLLDERRLRNVNLQDMRII
uniref:Uncharacterized protein n=1 Tax=Acrobeloides nanus TaxID=290746 RepID=A0A914CHH2_9BILA